MLQILKRNKHVQLVDTYTQNLQRVTINCHHGHQYCHFQDEYCVHHSHLQYYKSQLSTGHVDVCDCNALEHKLCQWKTSAYILFLLTSNQSLLILQFLVQEFMPVVPVILKSVDCAGPRPGLEVVFYSSSCSSSKVGLSHKVYKSHPMRQDVDQLDPD